MKNVYVFTFLALIQFIAEPAVYSQKFTAGGKIGMGISSLSNWEYRSSGSENKTRPRLVGLLVNLTGKYQFSDLLGLQAEFQYIQKGEGLKIAGSDKAAYKGKTRISYLTIPVLINVSHDFDKIVVYGVLGPYFGFGLSGKSISLEPYNGEKELKFGKGELRRFDMGLSIGAGAGYRLGPGDVFLDLRYDLGFMDIYSTSDEDKGTNYKATCNRSFCISVGYLIPLGKN